MLGIIGGTSLLSSALFAKWPTKTVRTPYGTVKVRAGKNAVFLQRHGNPVVPPHRINHRANIRALKDLGVSKVLAVNSTGSLKVAIRPGTFVIPDDFLSPWRIETFFDEEMFFMVPAMDRTLAKDIYDACRAHTKAVRLGGTYVQTIGPRLETKAEITMLKRFGDVVGMTLGSEATLAMEISLPYGSICSIDNYCNGIAKVPLTMEEISANCTQALRTIETILSDIIARVAL